MSKTLEPSQQLSPLKQAFLKLEEMQVKLKAMEQRNTEPIAIIGMGCRFPGGANDPDAFWQLCKDGVDGTNEIPLKRWDAEYYYNPDPEAEQKSYTRRGSFLDIEVDGFDANFFGISPREAALIDPQQRLLLEVSWEALENAGVALDKLRGSSSGVFVGLNTDDYGQLLSQSETAKATAYTFTGNTSSVAAGRISYTLGLSGPSLAIDTACSSSLVAVHLACQSLRLQECNLALAGGVNLMLSGFSNVVLSKMRALAPDGRCKTFAANADGYGRGEGCGVVVLKRLSQAIADGDNILSVIRGTAVNHDGRSSGLTVPNGLAQEAVLRAALENAKIEPARVSYVEVHGTGTALGDPIEVEALGNVLGNNRPLEQPLVLGSVKTNIGHLEAAAGIAGLIKVVLAIQHKEIPPHLHLGQLNENVDWENLPLTIPTTLTPWQTDEETCIAGVSSFGMSGTNAHVILEEGQQGAGHRAQRKLWEPPLNLLTLSAKSEKALQQLAGQFVNYLAAHPSESLADICFTANARRSHFKHRLAVTGKTIQQVLQQLTNFTSGKQSEGVSTGVAEPSSQPKVTFKETQESLDKTEICIPSLNARDEEWQHMLHDLAQMYVSGMEIDWQGFYRNYPGQVLQLPTYPFQRFRYWFEEPKTDNSQVDYLYELQWQSQPLAKQELEQLPDNWLIFAEQDNRIASALVEQLEEQSKTCIKVLPGNSYAKLGKNSIQINPEQPEDFQRLLKEVPCSQIVHLWSLDSQPIAQTTIDSLELDQARNCGSILHLVQALDATQLFPKLWLVTQNAQPVATEAISVVQGSVWGLGRVIALEHPELLAGLIDLPPEKEQSLANILLQEVCCSDGEYQVCWRNGERFVARLGHSANERQEHQKIKSDVTYLITGGVGGLGLKIAKWLAQQGAKHLMLLSRRGASSNSVKALQELEEMGVQVAIAKADVSCLEDVQRILAEINTNLPPLCGIIHLAGMLDDGVLNQQNWQRFSKVMSPKVSGSWNLHSQTRDIPLDFFINFSSAASLNGSTGQSSYAAANAFLDSLAHYRHSQGLPALTINWNPWADVGMAAAMGNQEQERWQAAGVNFISVEQGLGILGQLMGQNSPQIAVMPIDWGRLIQVFPSSFTSLFLQDISKNISSQLSSSEKQEAKLLETLKNTTPKQRKDVLITHLQQEVALVCGLDSSQLPQFQIGFFEMGMDSLMALELRNRLQLGLGIPLASTLTFEYPTIEALAEYLLKETFPKELPKELSSENKKTNQYIAEVKNLSEAELLALVEQELSILTG